MSCRVVPEFARGLRHDPSGEGFILLGKDGVLRSLNGKNEVVDAKALNPEQIQQLLDLLADLFTDPAEKDVFDGVDGTTVPKEQWYNPAPGILPERRTKEDKEGDVLDEPSMN